MATATLPVGAGSAAEASRARNAPHDDPYAHKYIIAIAVTFAAVLELIDTSIVNVAIPHMMGNLGATLDEISWVSTGYIIANVVVIPLSSWLSAYYGRRRYLTFSIVAFVIASFFCGAATTLGGLVFWRIVQGIGGGALLSTAQATLFETFPPAEVGIGQAMFGVGVMVGPTIGPTIGGYIVDNLSWPWIFYVNIPFGAVAGLLVWTYVRNSRFQKRSEEVDFIGIGLLTVAVGSLQWMLERGERFDWFESRFVTTLAVTSAISFVLLVWREMTTEHPVINFRILKSRQLAAGVLFASALGLGLYGSVFVLPVFLQTLHGFSAQQTGMVILPGAIASAITMAVSARVVGKIDARIPIVLGAFIFLGSMSSMSRMTYDSGVDDFFWPLIARGVGIALIFVPLTRASMAELEPKDIAQGTGLFNVMRQLGGSLGIAMLATLLSRYTKVQRVLLSEHLTANDPTTMERVSMLTKAMVAKGADALQASAQAMAILDRQVQTQASVLGFSRIYALSGLILVGSLPLLLLWRTGRTDVRGGSAADAH